MTTLSDRVEMNMCAIDIFTVIRFDKTVRFYFVVALDVRRFVRGMAARCESPRGNFRGECCPYKTCESRIDNCLHNPGKGFGQGGGDNENPVWIFVAGQRTQGCVSIPGDVD